MLFDLHCHNTIKPYYIADPETKHPPNPDHWSAVSRMDLTNKKYDWIVNLLTYELLFKNQGNFSSYLEGGFRCVCTALYPIERGFTMPKAAVQIPANLLLFTDVNRLIASIIGISVHSVKSIKSRGFQYFPDLLKEVNELEKHQKLPNRYAPGKSYHILSNFRELRRTIQNPKNIGVILTVEGVHAFISRNTVPADADLEREAIKPNSLVMDQLINEIKINITSFKQRYPLFFVTLAHHFFNLVCGHAPSVPRIVFNQRGSRDRYLNLGMTGYGEMLIEHLLARNPRRVLIDTKHMSPKARFWYHNFVKLKRKDGDNIPIIQSHTAVSGRPSLKKHISKPKFQERLWPFEKIPTLAKIQKTVNTSALNLFDDEILEIIESDGLIGLMVDEKRIVGKAIPEFSENFRIVIGRDEIILNHADIQTYRDTKKQLGIRVRKQIRLEDKLRRIKDNQSPKYLRVERRLEKVNLEVEKIRGILRPTTCAIFLNQVLHIAEVVGNVKCYDHISLGTDFDGVINPLDTYPEGRFMLQFKLDLIDFWNRRINDMSTQQFNTLRYGLDPADIMEKIMWKNAEVFLSRYFTNSYLIHGTGAFV